MYEAIITKLTNVRKHPGADRLQLAECMGEQVIVGLDDKEGDLGVYFPGGGKLHIDFLKANDLIAYKDEEGNKKGGLFDAKGKVRTQKLRGEKSEGFWCPINYLNQYLLSMDNTITISLPTEGTKLTTIAGYPLCERYETQKTKEQQQNNKQGQPKVKSKWFPEHVDTSQFLYELDHIPIGSRITISEKLHGTSQREGLVYIEYKLPWYKKALNCIYPWFRESDYEYCVGTRRVVLHSDKPDYYSDKDFRHNVKIKDNLLVGEVLYGEVVGFLSNGNPIMGEQPTEKTKDKTITNRYGKTMRYAYGCVPNVETELTSDDKQYQQKFYVYRILHKRPDYEHEFTQAELEERCNILGANIVPMFNSFIYDGNKEWLKQHVIDLAEGESTLDNSHIKEGVVLRVETPDNRVYFLKYKSFVFRVLEGLVKEQADYVDTEEAS